MAVNSKPKRKTKAFSEAEREFRALSQKLLAKHGTPRKALAHFKALESVDVWARYAKRFLCAFPYSSAMQRVYFPDSIAGLHNHGYLSHEPDLDREIGWAVLVCRNFSNELNQFVPLEASFHDHLLKGEYESAREVLGNVKSKFGYSFWYIQNILALTQEQFGLDKQKELSVELQKACLGENLAKYFAYVYSFRAEESVSADAFQRAVVEKLGNVPAGLRSYITFRSVYPAQVDYASVLNYEANSSVIDIYLTLIQISQRLIVEDACFDRQLVGAWLGKLDRVVEDPRLRNLSLAFGHVTNAEIDNRLLETLDAYTVGDYASSANGTEMLLMDNPSDLNLAKIYCKSLLRLRQDVSDRFTGPSERHKSNDRRFV